MFTAQDLKDRNPFALYGDQITLTAFEMEDLVASEKNLKDLVSELRDDVDNLLYELEIERKSSNKSIDAIESIARIASAVRK